MEEPILRAVSVTRAYHLGETIYAVHDVSLAIDRGEFVLVTGPSGSGKTTLLHLLAGLDRPMSGDVILDGTRYSRLSENGLAKLRREKIGFVFQFFNLIPHLTALENVVLPLRLAGMSPAEARERARSVLETVGLGHRINHLPGQLSGGEQQRVAVARALAPRPAVVLADEPTGNLDSNAGLALAGLFRKVNQEQGQTFVVVSHDPRLEEFADRVVVMGDGRIQDVRVRGGR